MRLRYLSNQELDRRMTALAKNEQKLLCLVIEHIREIDTRKLYLELGYSSLFEYLVTGKNYSEGSAQRRIEAARMSREIPEIQSKIQEGSLKLQQISFLQKAVRQAEKENPTLVSTAVKRDILQKIENKSHKESERIISAELNLPEIKVEKTQIQKNESVRMELTFSKDQMALMQKCKELLSHSMPNASWAEVISKACMELIKRKDPAQKRRSYTVKTLTPRKERPFVSKSLQNNYEIHRHLAVSSGNNFEDSKNEAHQEHLNPINKADTASTAKSVHKQNQKARNHIPAATRRFIFQRDQCCQHHDPIRGRSCRSQFLLEIDHIIPVWAGGTDDPNNLQLLCSQHNRAKYMKQARRHTLS